MAPDPTDRAPTDSDTTDSDTTDSDTTDSDSAPADSALTDAGAGTDADRQDGLRVRRATPDDRAAIIELCRASLGWGADDPNEAFFSWKHDDNPFGPSPAWVAETTGGELAGLRVFLRWRFRRPDGTTFDAVRAVDTATHPDWQGKGIPSNRVLRKLRPSPRRHHPPLREPTPTPRTDHQRRRVPVPRMHPQSRTDRRAPPRIAG